MAKVISESRLTLKPKEEIGTRRYGVACKHIPNVSRPKNSIMAKSLTDGEMVDGKKHGYWVTYYANGLKRSEGRYNHGKKEGLWIQYHKNGNKASEASFRDGKNEGDYMCYYENGNRKWGGPYREHDGGSADGRKEGVWLCYEEDGETVWRIITYKKGGRRAKPDEYPLGVCDVCGEGRRSTWGDTCSQCGAEIAE